VGRPHKKLVLTHRGSIRKEGGRKATGGRDSAEEGVGYKNPKDRKVAILRKSKENKVRITDLWYTGGGDLQGGE